MKKIFSFLSIAVAAFALHSCEDVPAPYEYPTLATEEGTNNRDVLTPINGYFAFEDFTDGTLGDFYAANTLDEYSWIADGKNGNYYAKASSYEDTDGDGESDNNPAESWLLAKPCDFSNVKGAYVSFDYILRYANSNQISTHYQVLVSKDYVKPATEDADVLSAAIKAATWETLPLTLVTVNDWNTWNESGKLAIPATYIGESRVTIALFYKSTNKAATWEVKNLTIGEGEATGEQVGMKKLLYKEDFASGLGDFTIDNKNKPAELSNIWSYDSKYTCAKASAFANSTKYDSESWLISPSIDLTAAWSATLTFAHAGTHFGTKENEATVMVKEESGSWTQLTINDWFSGWTFVDASINLDAYAGKKIQIAFVYKSTAENAGTWEVKNLAVEGVVPGESGDDTGNTDTPETLVFVDIPLPNSDFEGWTDGKPTHWKTASTAGNATLSQSADAHGGSYSVCVAGASANKRIGYEEMVLKAGTYRIKFYAKAATADGGTVCPGYATFKADGSINSSGYKYGEYVNDLSNTEWTEVNHEFTLDAEQKIALVIMNSKNPGKDVLIDDYTLTTAGGGIVGGDNTGGDTGGDETPDTPDTPEMEGYFSESFASSLGAFTIENKNMPSDLTYVWNHGTYNSDGFAKASAYKGQAYAAESWLISPSIDLTKASSATLSFSHAGNYVVDAENELYVKIKAEGGSWTTLTVNDWFESSKSYPFTEATINLNSYAGKKIQIAFVYTSTASNAGTWEIKNFVIK